MMEGSGVGSVPRTNPNPGGLKTSGSGSATLPLSREISLCCRFGQSHTVENEQACRRSVAVSGMLSQLQSEDQYLRAY